MRLVSPGAFVAAAIALLIGGGFDDRGEKHRHELIERYNVEEDGSVAWYTTTDDVRRYYAAADTFVALFSAVASSSGVKGLLSMAMSAGRA